MLGRRQPALCVALLGMETANCESKVPGLTYNLWCDDRSFPSCSNVWLIHQGGKTPQTSNNSSPAPFFYMYGRIENTSLLRAGFRSHGVVEGLRLVSTDLPRIRVLHHRVRGCAGSDGRRTRPHQGAQAGTLRLLEPPLMDAIATHTAKQKGVLRA